MEEQATQGTEREEVAKLSMLGTFSGISDEFLFLEGKKGTKKRVGTAILPGSP